jgi:hypothetical protein
MAAGLQRVGRDQLSRTRKSKGRGRVHSALQVGWLILAADVRTQSQIMLTPRNRSHVLPVQHVLYLYAISGEPPFAS